MRFEQQPGRLADRLELAEPLRERVGEFGGVGLGRLRRGRQQQARLQVGEPGRHDQIVGREFEPLLARGLDEEEILLGERQDGDAGQVDLLPPGELQQQVERTLEPVEIDREGGLAARPVGLEIAAKRRLCGHESPPYDRILCGVGPPGRKSGPDGVNRRTVSRGSSMSLTKTS